MGRSREGTQLVRAVVLLPRLLWFNGTPIIADHQVNRAVHRTKNDQCAIRSCRVGHPSDRDKRMQKHRNKCDGSARDPNGSCHSGANRLALTCESKRKLEETSLARDAISVTPRLADFRRHDSPKSCEAECHSPEGFGIAPISRRRASHKSLPLPVSHPRPRRSGPSEDILCARRRAAARLRSFAHAPAVRKSVFSFYINVLYKLALILPFFVTVVA